MSTFSVMCGTRACNANCPFCISKMTSACPDQPKWNPGRLQKAMWYVQQQGVSTAMITGRGEPTLYTEQLFATIDELDDYFPCIELQTNGILIPFIPANKLITAGLNTLCISVCSLNDLQNRELMGIQDDKFSVRGTIKKAVEDGFTVRVSFQLNKIAIGITHWAEHIHRVVRDAQSLGAHQITFRLIGKPDVSVNKRAANWVDSYGFQHERGAIQKAIEKRGGKKIATYHWGGMIYDVNGMSVCVADCLTEDPEKFEPRSWIFDGEHLRYSWQHKGAIVF